MFILTHLISLSLYCKHRRSHLSLLNYLLRLLSIYCYSIYLCLSCMVGPIAVPFRLFALVELLFAWHLPCPYLFLRSIQRLVNSIICQQFACTPIGTLVYVCMRASNPGGLIDAHLSSAEPCGFCARLSRRVSFCKPLPQLDGT